LEVIVVRADEEACASNDTSGQQEAVRQSASWAGSFNPSPVTLAQSLAMAMCQNGGAVGSSLLGIRSARHASPEPKQILTSSDWSMSSSQ
jgi:hypothetical protein